MVRNGVFLFGYFLVTVHYFVLLACRLGRLVVLYVLVHFSDTARTVVLSELILKHLYIRFYNDIFCDVLILIFGTPFLSG